MDHVQTISLSMLVCLFVVLLWGGAGGGGGGGGGGMAVHVFFIANSVKQNNLALCHSLHA